MKVFSSLHSIPDLAYVVFAFSCDYPTSFPELNRCGLWPFTRMVCFAIGKETGNTKCGIFILRIEECVWKCE